MIFEDDQCSGCGICVGYCPSKALSIKLNQDGFFRPSKNEKCVGCGICDAICPFKKLPDIARKNLSKDEVFGSYHKVFACCSHNSDIRQDSSTAGFIRTFCSYYANDFDAVMTLTNNDDNPLKPEVSLLTTGDEIIAKSAKSTYFSVEYSKAAEILRTNKGRFLIVGIPCQIAAINNLNKILKRDIFTIELFCGAVYSHNLMQKYFVHKGVEPKSIDFRDKCSGWHDFSLALKGVDIKDSSAKTVKTKANDDEFYFCQRNKFCTQDTCLKCSYCYRGTADIQVGDFWGEKYNSDEKGVNLVLSRSLIASKMIEKCTCLKSKACSIQDVHQSQPWFVVADARIRQYKGENGIVLPEAEKLENKIKLNHLMQNYINHGFDINYLRDVFFKHKADLERKYQFKYKNSFLIIPSDVSSMQSFGDQAMMASLLRQIYRKHKKPKISYFSFNSGVSYKNFSEDYGYDIPILQPDADTPDTLSSFKKHAQKFENLIIIGADILDGGCGREHAMLYFSIIKEALFMNMNVIITGFSFNDRKYPEIMSAISAVSHMGVKLHARDRVSFDRLQKIGCVNLTQVADMAFLFDEKLYKISPFADEMIKKLKQYQQEGKKIVGLHLTAKPDEAEIFSDKMAQTLSVYKDVVFVLFPQDYRVYSHLLSDQEFLTIVENKLKKYNLKVENAFHLQNEIDVKSVVQYCDLLITSRMHIAIAALSREVPVISFIYQGKFEGLYAFYDFKHNLMFEKNNFSEEELKKAINYLLSSNLKPMISQANNKIFDLSKRNFDFLNEPESTENEGPDEYQIVSLGYNCFTHRILTENGIKPAKVFGELTGPFDLCVTPVSSLAQILKNDFNDYFEDLVFDEYSGTWRNSKYNLYYNHDNDLKANDRDKLVERYRYRIENFNSFLKNDKHVYFILLADSESSSYEINEIYHLILQKRAENFTFIAVDFWSRTLNVDQHINVLSISTPYQDFSSMWFNDRYRRTLAAKSFEYEFCNDIVKIITQKHKLKLYEPKDEGFRKKQIFVNFADFPSPRLNSQIFTPYNNFIIDILKKRYTVVISDQPDFLFYSVFGNSFENYDNCVKIFFTSENVVPNFNHADYAIGFDDIQFEDRYLKYPIYYDEMDKAVSDKSQITKDYANRKFCNFIYSNASSGEGSKFRIKLCQLLSTYKKVDCPGKVLNNMTDAINARGDNFKAGKLKFQKNYKFTIAVENSASNGYVTEKIAHAFMAHTIPIYWGAPDICKDFNPKAFINCRDYVNLDEVVKKVVELDNNDEAYMEMLYEPPMREGYTFDKRKQLEAFLFNIIEKGNTPFNKLPNPAVNKYGFCGEIVEKSTFESSPPPPSIESYPIVSEHYLRKLRRRRNYLRLMKLITFGQKHQKYKKKYKEIKAELKDMKGKIRLCKQ